MTNERNAKMRPAAYRGLGAVACVLLAAGCGEEPTRPLDHSEFETSPAASLAVALDCTVDIRAVSCSAILPLPERVAGRTTT